MFDIGAVIGATALVGIVGLLAWLVVDGLRNGVVRMRGGSYSRTEEPAWFWTLMALYFGMNVFVIYQMALLFLPSE